jgi:polyferredoxin
MLEGRKTDILPCGDFIYTATSQFVDMIGELARRFCTHYCPTLPECCVSLFDARLFENLLDSFLLMAGFGALFVWLLLPESWWQGWLCGYSMLGMALLAFAMWRATRELRLRLSLETSAASLVEENAKLKASSEQMSSDLNMLQVRALPRRIRVYIYMRVCGP